MNSSLTLYFVVLAVVLYIAYSSLKIAAENERYASFFLGRFYKFKGPGLFIVARNLEKLVSLKVGDVGTVSSSQFVNFGETDIPIASAASFRPGDSVRIEAFDEAGPILTVSNVVAKRSCPKCGHAF